MLSVLNKVKLGKSAQLLRVRSANLPQPAGKCRQWQLAKLLQPVEQRAHTTDASAQRQCDSFVLVIKTIALSRDEPRILS